MTAAATRTPTKGTDTMTDNLAPTTLADLLAAVELGAIDPSTPVVPESAIADRIRAAAETARKAGHDAGVTEATRKAAETFGTGTLPAGTVALPAGVHDCAVSGCAHGSVHGPDYVPQPDRQTVLLAPCGSRLRVTNRALALAGGVILCGHGDAYAPTARRAYSPRAK